MGLRKGEAGARKRRPFALPSTQRSVPLNLVFDAAFVCLFCFVSHKSLAIGFIFSILEGKKQTLDCHGHGHRQGDSFLFLAYSWMGGGHLLLCMYGWTTDMVSWMIVTINTSSQFLIFLSFHCVWFCFVVHGDDIWVAMRTSAFGFGMAFLDIIGGQSGLEDFLCASWLWMPLEFIIFLYILSYLSVCFYLSSRSWTRMSLVGDVCYVAIVSH